MTSILNTVGPRLADLALTRADNPAELQLQTNQKTQFELVTTDAARPDQTRQPGAEVALNPQPLNPQPLPPRWVAAAVRYGDDYESLKGVQTLPPRWNNGLFDRIYEEVMLNPQPLPPVADARHLFDAVATRSPTDPSADLNGQIDRLKNRGR